MIDIGVWVNSHDGHVLNLLNKSFSCVKSIQCIPIVFASCFTQTGKLKLYASRFCNTTATLQPFAVKE